MRRRELIFGIGGLTLALPRMGAAQQPVRSRRIGFLTGLAQSDPEGRAREAAFVKALEKLGWIEGSSLRIDVRRRAGDASLASIHAAELVGLAPEVIVANGQTAVEALTQASPTIPIVAVNISEPYFVRLTGSLARPGGRITGFASAESGWYAKMIQLLKEVAPNIERVLYFNSPRTTTFAGAFTQSIDAAAKSLGIEAITAVVQSAAEIERAIEQLAARPNGGLCVGSSALNWAHRDLIVNLAMQHRAPAIYPNGFYPSNGGLLSYGVDVVEMHRQAASYVDRILRGEKAGDLPIQLPTKYELVVNLKAAEALALTFPPTILARADEVIE